MMKPLALLLPILLTTACMHLPDAAERQSTASTLAATRHWQARDLMAGAFTLRAWLSPRQTVTLTVYLEGDGLAWITPSLPSDDPTPLQPLALQLALAQPDGQAAYLARPCQYLAAQAACTRRYWTSHRFAPEVVDSMNQGLDQLKQQTQAARLQLVGYSGGAAVALLLAAQRHDVQRVITVAGNVDPEAWSQLLGLTPLSGSLNPVAVLPALQAIPQWHLVGGNDRVIPPQLSRDFAARFDSHHRPVVRILPGFDHHCCWAVSWPSLWQEIMSTPADSSIPSQGTTGS